MFWQNSWIAFDEARCPGVWEKQEQIISGSLLLYVICSRIAQVMLLNSFEIRWRCFPEFIKSPFSQISLYSNFGLAVQGEKVLSSKQRETRVFSSLKN